MCAVLMKGGAVGTALPREAEGSSWKVPSTIWLQCQHLGKLCQACLSLSSTGKLTLCVGVSLDKTGAVSGSRLNFTLTFFTRGAW